MKFIFILFLFSSSLLSKATPSLAKSIKILYDTKAYGDACALSEEFFKLSPNNYKANIYYGRCALFRGNIDKAMAAYDRAEILNEKSAHPHRFLGDLYAYIGNIEIAKEEYEKADRLGKKPVSREVVSDHKVNAFSFLMHFGAGNDSNVNYSAELSEMLDWGYVNKPQSDNFTKEYIRLTHVYDADPYSAFYYKSQIHAYNKNYTLLHEQDFTQGNFYTGPGWTSNTFDIWIPLGYTYMATDYQSYAELYSVSPQIRKIFANKVLLKLETNFVYQKYLQWNESDQLTYSGKLSLSRWFSDNYFKIAYRYLQADKANKESPRVFLDKYFHEAEFDYARKITKSLEAGLGFLYRVSNYTDLARVGLSDIRKDELSQYSAYISYNITKEFGIVIKYDNYDNNTNYVPSDYTKEVVSGGLYLSL